MHTSASNPAGWSVCLAGEVQLYFVVLEVFYLYLINEPVLSTEDSQFTFINHGSYWKFKVIFIFAFFFF